VIWGAVIEVIFVVLQVVTIVLVVVSRGGNRNLSESELIKLFSLAGEDGYLLSLATFATTVVGCALIIGAIKLKKGSVVTAYLCIRAVSLRTILTWIGLLAALLVLSDSITTMLGRPIVPPFMSAVYATADPLWMIWVALI